MKAPASTTGPWTLAQRAEKMNPSVIREILKVTERPGIISFAGGLPSPKTFPVAEFASACAKVLRDDAHDKADGERWVVSRHRSSGSGTMRRPRWRAG